MSQKKFRIQNTYNLIHSRKKKGNSSHKTNNFFFHIGQWDREIKQILKESYVNFLSNKDDSHGKLPRPYISGEKACTKLK